MNTKQSQLAARWVWTNPVYKLTYSWCTCVVVFECTNNTSMIITLNYNQVNNYNVTGILEASCINPQCLNTKTGHMRSPRISEFWFLV